MLKFLKRSAKGAAVPHEKGTAAQPTVKMPVPEHVIIPMLMHIGAPAEPVVAPGDHVEVGDLIAQMSPNALGSSIHASIRGRVEAVGERIVIEKE